jgi:hypothetical protein
MPADNPSLILQALDARLDHPVELHLIGKSALWLGYDDPPVKYGVTQDVDAVVPGQQSDQMNEDLSFWDALQAANEELAGIGIYLTHIFEEQQIILRPDWFAHRVSIRRPELVHIKLFRPSTLDLILSKMMRGADPQHMDEIQWMISHDQIKRIDLEIAFSTALVPDDPEIRASFEIAKPRVLAMAVGSL